MTADADGQHHPDDIEKVARALEEQPHWLVLGVRRFQGAVPWRSRMGNELSRRVVHLVVGQKLTDTQTGLRGIPAMLAARLLEIEANGYEFELEMLIAAHQLGVPIKEEPIRTIYEAGNASSHFNPLVDSMKIYFVLLRFASVSVMTAVLDNVVFYRGVAADGAHSGVADSGANVGGGVQLLDGAAVGIRFAQTPPGGAAAIPDAGAGERRGVVWRHTAALRPVRDLSGGGETGGGDAALLRQLRSAAAANFQPADSDGGRASGARVVDLVAGVSGDGGGDLRGDLRIRHWPAVHAGDLVRFGDAALHPLRLPVRGSWAADSADGAVDVRRDVGSADAGGNGDCRAGGVGGDWILFGLVLGVGVEAGARRGRGLLDSGGRVDLHIRDDMDGADTGELSVGVGRGAGDPGAAGRAASLARAGGSGARASVEPAWNGGASARRWRCWCSW